MSTEQPGQRRAEREAGCTAVLLGYLHQQLRQGDTAQQRATAAVALAEQKRRLAELLDQLEGRPLR